MAMRRIVTPLLCELHAHTTWSDGLLSVAELVDLYGRSGFDVLCVTDHALPHREGVEQVRDIGPAFTVRTSPSSAPKLSAHGPSTTCSSFRGSSSPRRSRS